MRISLVVIGKTKNSYLEEGITLFSKRVARYSNFTLQVIPDSKHAHRLKGELLKKKEGEQILQHLQSSDYVVLLDERGKQYTSLRFANFLQQCMNSNVKHLKFVIGGAFGFSTAVYKRANAKISLSSMTFSHQMVRLIFVEQLYRGYSILHKQPYHHE